MLYDKERLYEDNFNNRNMINNLSNDNYCLKTRIATLEVKYFFIYFFTG